MKQSTLTTLFAMLQLLFACHSFASAGQHTPVNHHSLLYIHVS
ncbi:MAG: hypothetical protein V4604_15210 [Bacteroidota bacterium]